MSATPKTAPATTETELRIHGIGNHQELSAVGAPILYERLAEGRVNVYSAPNPPGHVVKLLNWSRVTRRVYRVGWWILFPLTLINAAGFMTPLGKDSENVPHSISTSRGLLTWAVATAVTVGYMLWLGTLIDTLPLALPATPRGIIRWVAFSAIIVFAFSRMISAGNRPVAAQKGSITPPRMLWFIQLLAMGGTWAWIELAHPASLSVSTGPWSSCWFTPTADCRPELSRFDLLGAFVLASTTIALVFAVIGTIGRSSKHPTRFTFYLSLSAAFLLLNTLFETIRIGLTWIVSALENLRMIPVPSLKGADLFDFWEMTRVVLPFRTGRGLPTTAVPVIALLWTIAVILVARFIVKLWQFLNGTKTRPPRTRSDEYLRRWRYANAQKMHDDVAALPKSLIPVALFAIVLMLLSSGTLLLAAINVDLLTARQHGFLALHLRGFGFVPIAIGVLLFLFRARISTIGDIIGFWPRRYAVLGGESYTEEVVTAIRDVATTWSHHTSLVVCGHSQGSVLSYTVFQRAARDQDPNFISQKEWCGPALVTCGSPLVTLYVKLFPAYFSQSDIDSLRAEMNKRWLNFWRDTDPIAGPIFHDVAGGAGDVHIQDTWDTWDGHINRHSNYWTEPLQLDGVRSLFDLRAASQPVEVENNAV